MPKTDQPNSPNILILLVEDYDGDALLIQEKLRISQISGYRLERTASLAETRTWLQENTPDVILLDMNIGDSEGLPTIEAVFEACTDAAIVVLTGNHGDEMGFSALEAGAQDFLGKDEINARNLRRIVAFALSRRRFQIRQLKQAIAQYAALAAETADAPAPDSANTRESPAQPANAITPTVHADLTQEYSVLLKAYLDSLIVSKTKPRVDLDALVERLGAAGAGPKDVLGLHVAALEDAMAEARPERARFLNTDGRLLALEVMGRLVSFYRTNRTGDAR